MTFVRDKNLRRFLALVCISLAIAGCAGSPTGAIFSSPTILPTSISNLLTTTHWNLVLLNGQPLIPGSTITLSFNDGDMRGEVSCNSYWGPVSVDDKQIKRVEGFQVTVVGCTPEEINVQSETYITTLTALNPIDYRLIEGGSQLEILNANGEAVLLYDAVLPWTETPTPYSLGVPRSDQ